MSPHQADELTGASTRGSMESRLAEIAGSQLSGGPDYAVAMLDLDHLKTVNDVYGHAAGDIALRTVSNRIRDILRAEDGLYRIGGDEFVVILPGIGRQTASTVMQRVRDHVTAQPAQAATWIRLSVSVGVAASEEISSPGPTAVLERADLRLNLAKRSGRNAVVDSDRPNLSVQSNSLSETRLFGREAELHRVREFLESTGPGSEHRLLQLTGPAGAGFSRFLDEVAIRVGLNGRNLRRLRAEAPYARVHLRSLQVAYQDELSADASAEAVSTRLRNEAESHGLVVLVEGGNHLDPGSRMLLSERLDRGGTWVIEAVPEGQPGAFSAPQRISLGRLGAADMNNWLAAATGGPVEPASLSLLTELAAGRPGVLVPVLNRLLSSGELHRVDGYLTGTATAIRAAFSRHSAADQPRIDLPQWETPLVGRSRFLETVRPEAQGTGLLVLTGPGGVGKSRLAAQLALELAPGMPDGTYWVDLRGLQDASLLGGKIASDMGLDSTGQLADRRARVVLDGFDGIAGDAGVLDSIRRQAPGLRFVVTARMPLRLPGETVIPVHELSSSAAAELFRLGVDRAGGNLMAERAEIMDLLDRVGYSPLAIELASAWMRGLDVQELTRVLDAQPELLVKAPGLEPRTSRFIDVTRQLMSPLETRSLGILALIPGGFAAQQAAQAADASPFFLLALLERSLLRREGSRYTVHTAIAERFRAGLQDPEAARQAVTIAWLDLAGQLNAMSMQERTDSGFRTVDTEWLNFSYIWKVLLEKGESENRLWPLARLLRGYLDVRGRYQDGVALFGRADAALIEGHDRELRGWMRECVALFNHKLGRNQEAAGIAGTAIGFLRPLGDNQTLAMTLNTAGLIAMQLGNHPAALEHLEEAASMRDALGDAIGAAQARGNRLANLEAMGRETEALEGMAAAAAQYRQLGHPSGLAAMLVRQGKLLYRLRKDLAGEAMQLMQEGLDLAESIGYAETASSGARAMAESHAHLGRHAEAAAMYERAVTWETQRPEVARRLLLSAAEQRERHTRSLAGGRFGG